MRPEVLWLHDAYEGTPLSPFHDDMFDRMDKLSRMAADPEIGGLSLGTAVGFVLSPPTPGNVKPERVLIGNPVYGNDGIVEDVHFKLGNIAEYAVIMDRAVRYGLRHRTVNEKGIVEEHATGIGIEDRVINARSLQEYGNRKDLTEKDILVPARAALTSYGLHDIKEYNKTWGSGPVIYKPIQGSHGRDIEVYDSLGDLRHELNEHPEKIQERAILQPYFDLREPISGLVPKTPAYADQLQKVNSTADRVREIRNHLFISTDPNGDTTVTTTHTLRTGAPGEKYLDKQEYTPLDSEAYKQARPLEASMAERVGYAAAKAANISFGYAVVDIAIGSREGQTLSFALDFNCRGPRNPDLSLPGRDLITDAQRELVLLQKNLARTVLG